MSGDMTVLEAVGGTLGAIVGIFFFYCFIWWFFYPNIGTVCDESNVVKSIVLTGHSWGEDDYRTTFTDGIQANTGYHKIGDTVCLKQSAKLFPW